MKTLRSLALTLVVSTSLCAASGVMAQGQRPAPISTLVKDIKLPYQIFQLDNGLTVVVHEDRKAPVVGVSVWYRVGSKHEPAGKTGFAHLFEHLMFSGSENAPTDYFEPLQRIGATDLNGTTWYDRTNYYQTVPSGALDTALFLESDRMGHLLGAVTQEKLDNQRSVVQNEKRQGDNAPYGLLRYEIGETLLPKGHPYRHSTIGSMGDLNSATLVDVRKWFVDHYGPNNAVLVLAGDIDVPTAREKVQKYFGDISRGLDVTRPAVSVPTLPAPVYKEMTDMVPAETIFRNWAAPGLLDPDNAPLTVGLHILGGLSSSRLDNAMVRNSPVAVRVSANLQTHEDLSFVSIMAVAADGVDAAALGKRLDAEIAAFLESGPTQDEVDRAVTSYIATGIKGLDVVGGRSGKATQLAEGTLYANDPDFYVKQLQSLSQITPAAVKAAMEKWLTRPVFGLTYKPGPRTEGGEHRGGADVRLPPLGEPAYYRDPAQTVSARGLTGLTLTQAVGQAAQAGVDRSVMPVVQDLAALEFPDIERGRLSNGIEVIFARRSSLPVVQAAISFDAGYAADPRNGLGTQSLMLNLMEEGTKSLDSIRFAEAQERLGATISGVASADDTIFTLSALKPNLQASLGLFADFIQHPAFDVGELERVRGQLLVQLREEFTNPNRTAIRVFGPAVYGPNHPYGVPSSGLGTEASLRAITQQDVVQFHRDWLRPDNARIFVVGDTSLRDVTRALNASFGKWKVNGAAKPVKDFNVAVPNKPSHILFVNRPNAPQSVILVGRALDLKGTDSPLALEIGNEVIGGSFLSRFNMNLREDKGWSYGAQSRIAPTKERLNWFGYAAVQADRTGDSIVEIQKDLREFLDEKGTTEDELDRTVVGKVRELPGRFETSNRVLLGLLDLVKYNRADDYYEKLPSQYEALKTRDVDAEARKYLTSDGLIYVVVGDAKTVRPQLEALDLPIETVSLSN